MTDDDGQLSTYSFRAEQDRVEYLDWLIKQKNADLPPGTDEEISRSDVLRECIETVIEDLEEELDEGNPRKPAMATAD